MTNLIEVLTFGGINVATGVFVLLILLITLSNIIVTILSCFDRVFSIFHDADYDVLEKKIIIDFKDKETERIVFNAIDYTWCTNFNGLWFKFMYYVLGRKKQGGIVSLIFVYCVAAPISIPLYVVTYIFDINRFIPCRYCGQRAKSIYGFCSACTPCDLFKASIAYHDEKVGTDMELDRELHKMKAVIMRDFYTKSQSRKEFKNLLDQYLRANNKSVENSEYHRRGGQ